MASLRARHNKFEAKVRIPQALQRRYGNRQFLYRTLRSPNRPAAKLEAAEWENGLKLDWAAEQGHRCEVLDGLRAERRVYQQVRAKAAQGTYQLHAGGDDPTLAGIDHELEKLSIEIGPRDLSPVEAARVAALQDAASELQGREVAVRRELEPSVSEVAAEYMAWWSKQGGLKKANTGAQKRATFRLFAGFFGDRPLREVKKPDAAKFMDALRSLDPCWSRSPVAKKLNWNELIRRFGQHEAGLSASTLNRHAVSLGNLWDWAEERDYCTGRSPFKGFRQRLRPGVNTKAYQAWEDNELNTLFANPPKRADMRELILVGMFSGMRIDEIASLTGDQVMEREGIRYIDVRDAKTPAGNREVPLHPHIGWLWDRARAVGNGRVFPDFNCEGPGKKPGSDASREFSYFKAARGFKRTKSFHSFRKNVTRIMERARVRENEWAQVLGHEKGFTYGRYNADGITLASKAKIIELIAYPGVKLPEPSH